VSDPFYAATGLRANVSGVFVIDIANLIRKRTKYGLSLIDSDSSIRDEILSSLEFKSIIVNRHRVNLARFSNSLGTQGIMEYEKIESKKILHGTDIGGFKTFSDQFMFNDGSPQNDAMEIITTTLNEITTGGSTQRTFEFNDYELDYNSPGNYKYSIKLNFVDPSANFINNMKSQIEGDLLLLKTYHLAMQKTSHYNYSMNKIKERFFTSVNNETPWEKILGVSLDNILLTEVKNLSFILFIE